MKNIHVQNNIGISLLGISYNLGSDFETNGVYGTHHLMEHLNCKPVDYLRSALKRAGIYHNAFTDTDRLCFYFQGLDENLSLYAYELYEKITAGTYAWSEEDFNNEKKTVIQEYEDVFNDQINGTLTNLIRKHYNYFGPIGLKTDIENFSYNNSLEFRERFVRPHLICQVGTNNLSLKDIINNKTKTFNVPVFGNYDLPQETIPKEGKTAVGLLGKTVIGDAERNKIKIVLSCINSGLESPLYQEIREKRGLSYFSYGFMEKLYNYNVLVFLSSTSNENSKELTKVYKEFFSGDLSRHITKDRFEDCYSEIIISKKKCERLPHEGVFHTVLSKSPFEGIDEFTYEEALALLNKYFGFDNFVEIEY